MTYERSYHAHHRHASSGFIAFAVASADILDYKRTIVDSPSPHLTKPDHFIEMELGFPHAVRPFLSELVDSFFHHKDSELWKMSQFLVVAQYDPQKDKIVNKQIIPLRDIKKAFLPEQPIDDKFSKVGLEFRNNLNEEDISIVKEVALNLDLNERLLTKARRWNAGDNKRLGQFQLVKNHCKMIGIRQAPFSVHSLDTDIHIDRFNSKNIELMETFFNKHVTSIEYGIGDLRSAKLFYAGPLTAEMVTGMVELFKRSEFDILYYQTNTLGNEVVEAEVLNLSSGSFGIHEQAGMPERGFVDFHALRHPKGEGALRFAEQLHNQL
jgi:hypothetical protein